MTRKDHDDGPGGGIYEPAQPSQSTRVQTTMPLQSVNTQYNSDGYVKKNKMTLKESAMLVFNLLKISSIVEFLPSGWFSSENDHLNVDKDTTKEEIVRKPESPALSESVGKLAAHAAPSYSETVRKPAAKTSRHTTDYLPADPNSKSRSAKSYTRSTTNLLSRKANNILVMMRVPF